MRRILLKFLPVFLFSAFIFLIPQNLNALTISKTSVSIKQNSTSSNENFRQSAKIQIKTNGEGTTTVNSDKDMSPTVTVQQSGDDKKIISSAAPTLKPSPTSQTKNSSEPTPTKLQPTPIKAQSIPSIQPTSTLTQTFTQNQEKAYIMEKINDYRLSLGLSRVGTSAETCDFAKIRSLEISSAFNHDGFRNRINNGTIPYNKWSLITENLAMTANYKNVVNMWIASNGHAANMRKDTPFVCVENYGNYYAYEGMKP